MSNALPTDVQQLVDDLLATKQYDSEAAVMREALRLLKQRDDLKRSVQQSIDELDRGEGIDGDAVFNELRAKAAELGAIDE